jgi:hypothetical protein
LTESVDLAYTTKLPERPCPKVTQYRVWVCRCTVWGTQVRSQHPKVAPDQYTATAHRVGARVMTAVHALHDGLGIPVRKVPLTLAELTGVRLTQEAIIQDTLQRTAGGVGIVCAPQCRRRRWCIRMTPAGACGASSHLMVFETEAGTVYQIRPRHRHEEVQAVISTAYAGIMVTDRGRSYDAQAFDDVDQHKCLAHILQSISTVVAAKSGRARDFGAQLKGLLQETLALWHAPYDRMVTDFKVDAEAL